MNGLDKQCENRALFSPHVRVRTCGAVRSKPGYALFLFCGSLTVYQEHHPKLREVVDSIWCRYFRHASGRKADQRESMVRENQDACIV